MHEAYDSSITADALAERSTFSASGGLQVSFESFGRAHSGHMQHAIVLPLRGSPAGVLFDMHFRVRSRVDGLARLLMRQHSELIMALKHNGLTQRKVLLTAG